MSKHTPTPWVTHEMGGTIYIGRGKQDVTLSHIVATVYCDENYIEESKQSRRANAAFIVRACNAHEQLVTALSQLLDNIATEAWEALPQYVQDDAMAAYNKARGEA